MGIRMDGEQFEALTHYANQSDNYEDNIKRAEILGFGGRSVQVAPGAIVRVRDQSKIGSRIFIGYCIMR